MSYYNLIGIDGYHNKPEYIPHAAPQTKFLVLIPAVNEESVIYIPVTDLLAQKYPKELFQVVVIADHCTDNTANIARNLGVKVVETSDNLGFKRHGIGKANTLDYGLHQTNWHEYDYMVVIDSDNNVSSNFLQRMNDVAVKSQPAAIQSALESKKGKGFINNGLNLSFRRSRRFQQNVESKYGVASLMGTGFATRTDVLEYVNGFRWKSLVEDQYQELQIIARLDGDVKFIDDCHVTNENYPTIGQAKKGLVRWSKGSFECFYRFIGVAIKNLILNPFSLRN